MPPAPLRQDTPKATVQGSPLLPKERAREEGLVQGPCSWWGGKDWARLWGSRERGPGSAHPVEPETPSAGEGVERLPDSAPSEDALNPRATSRPHSLGIFP